MLTVAFATGTEPGKWFSRFARNTAYGLETTPSDDPLSLLTNRDVDLALVRLPDDRIDENKIGEDYLVVKLYAETPGIAVPKDSVYAEVGQQITAEDIDDEIINFSYPISHSHLAVDELRQALQVVAANVGVAIAPAPLLKALSKKQVRVLDYAADELASTQIALVWHKAEDCEMIQDFVGITKGRTRNSTRQSSAKPNTKQSRKRKR